MTTYTKEQAEAWIAENEKDCLQGLAESTEVPSFMKSLPTFSKMWCAGCWLHTCLEECGATPEQIERIGFAHGQRSFGGDPVQIAVIYVNAFAMTKTIPEQPGAQLAEKINSELFG